MERYRLKSAFHTFVWESKRVRHEEKVSKILHIYVLRTLCVLEDEFFYRSFPLPIERITASYIVQQRNFDPQKELRDCSINVLGYYKS